MAEVTVPLDVPKNMRKIFLKNYNDVTHKSGRLMLFAGDQKIEHLNSDFYGKGIHADNADPEHLFRIAAHANIGAFATQLGLIARYGMDYHTVNYIVKLNSKTNLVPLNQREPHSELLTDVEQVAEFRKNSGLKIRGVGFTLYLGSEFESQMLADAAQIIYEAHHHGLVAILWIYPRGKAIKNGRDPHLIAGATGVAACLGADFVKVSYPSAKNQKEAFKEAVSAAGKTKVICAGGKSVNVKSFFSTLRDQIDAGAGGNATARNIHQKGLTDAIRMCNAIYAITVKHATPTQALDIYHNR